jgi:hypothetical protein
LITYVSSGSQYADGIGLIVDPDKLLILSNAANISKSVDALEVSSIRMERERVGTENILIEY